MVMALVWFVLGIIVGVVGLALWAMLTVPKASEEEGELLSD